jgi:flagellar basal body L-ring protein FlgH
MKKILFAVITLALVCASLTAIAQAPNYKSDITTGQTQMSAAQAAQYKAEYQSAKERWAKMTPQQQQATIASARAKKLQDLTAIELVGQRDDMRNETAAQSGALKAQSDAAKASWDKMTPAQKEAARKSAWAKKRAELDGIERTGQNDDTYILPW